MTRAPVLLVAAVVVAALAGCVPQGGSGEPDRPTGAVLVAAPDGGGSGCTEAEPCSLQAAIEREPAEIRLAGGEYGDLELDGGSGGAALARLEPVKIRPLEGAEPVIGKLDLNRPGSSWIDVRFTGGIYLDEGADDTTLDGVHVDGSGVFVHSSGVRILDSVIENGTSIDGIQVGGADDLLVEGTIVRGFGQGADSEVHSDCVQLFDSTGIVLRGNYFGACDNASLIFSPGGGDGIRDVLVESNFLQGCVVENDRCSRGTALDLREASAADVVVRNNTILDGSTMVEPLDGLVFDRNIVGYASNCEMPMTNTIVVAWNTGTCDRPDALGRDGNRAGEVSVVDRQGGDLRLVDPGQATIDPSGGSEPASAGYGGEPLPHDLAGAGG